MDRDKFEAVFHDAHVIDVDFSLWDRSCTFVVIAAEETAFPAKRLPVYCVDFSGTTHFEVEFPEKRPLEDGHYQWWIHQIHLHEEGDVIHLRMSGPKPTAPIIHLRCRDIFIEHLDIRILDELFPGWSKPSSPLARPGIREMARRAGLAPSGRVWN